MTRPFSRLALGAAALGLAAAALQPLVATAAVRPQVTYPKTNYSCALLVQSNAYKSIAKAALDSQSTGADTSAVTCAFTKGGSDGDVPGIMLVIFRPAVIAAMPGASVDAKVKSVATQLGLPVKVKSTPSMGPHAYYGHGKVKNETANVVIWYQNKTIAVIAESSVEPPAYPIAKVAKSIQSTFKAGHV